MVLPLCNFSPRNSTLRGRSLSQVLLCTVEIHDATEQPQTSEEHVVQPAPITNGQRLLQQLIQHTIKESKTSKAYRCDYILKNDKAQMEQITYSKNFSKCLTCSILSKESATRRFSLEQM